MRRLYRQFRPQPTTTESYLSPTSSFENSIIINHPFLHFFSLEIMKNIFYLLVIFGTYGRKNFRKKTFHNRVLNPERESLKLSMSSIEVRTKNPGTCQKPRIALANGASLQCPDRIGDRDRCRYRCPKGFILKPGSNNVIGIVLHFALDFKSCPGERSPDDHDGRTISMTCHVTCDLEAYIL